MFPKDAISFFHNIIKTGIKTRVENNIYRPDLLNQLIALKSGRQKLDYQPDLVDDANELKADPDQSIVTPKFTDLDITAQGMVFFLAAFETVSSLMCFMSHELALHPDVQEKLQKEIDEIREDCGDKLTYDTLGKLKYMDMVISGITILILHKVQLNFLLSENDSE